MNSNYNLESVESKMLSKNEREACYSLGYYLYQNEQYEEALPFFALLTCLEPTNATYHYVVGACEKMLGKYEEAMKDYGIAFLLDSSNFSYGIEIAQCQLANGQTPQAIDTLMKLAKMGLEIKPEPTEFVYQIEELLALCRKDLH